MGASLNPNQILFIGRGRSPALLHYRIQMPAEALGCDWIGVIGNPKMLTVTTGRIGGKAFPPGIHPPDNTKIDVSRYETIVLQYNQDENWPEWVEGMRASGVRVLVDVDDWLHGVRHVRNHLARKNIRGRHLQRLGELMRVADGLIVSTPFLAELTERFNPDRWVCGNGVRASRYRFDRLAVDRPVVVGWAGSTGHDEALTRWAPGIVEAIGARPETRLLTVGANAAPLFGFFGLRERVGALPMTPLDNYPAMLTHFDVGLAPAGTTDWALAKSELRWIELSAAGIPAIVDPLLYKTSVDGETALWATKPSEVRDAIMCLVDTPDLRHTIGRQAQKYVTKHFDIGVRAGQWREVLDVQDTSDRSGTVTL